MPAAGSAPAATPTRSRRCRTTGDVRRRRRRDDAARRRATACRPEYDHVYAFHYGIPKPIIAAINGAAAGVGLVLACFCDIRFAAAGAKLTTSSGRLALPAEHGLSWVLPRLVGIGHAADLLLSSRVVLAEEAAQIGLVNRVLAA